MFPRKRFELLSINMPQDILGNFEEKKDDAVAREQKIVFALRQLALSVKYKKAEFGQNVELLK